MPQWLQNLLSGNTIQFLVFALVVGGGFFQWLLRALKEQADAKKAKAEQAKRAEQLLRTGKPAADAAPRVATAQATEDPRVAERRRRMQELAERRREQIEELRRRQQARQSISASTAPSAPTQQRAPTLPAARPAPSGPRLTPKQTAELARRRELARREEQRRLDQLKARKTAQVVPATLVDIHDREAMADTPGSERSTVASVVRSGGQSGKGKGLAALLGSRASVRDAIILTEVLGKPLSQRDPQQGPAPNW